MKKILFSLCFFSSMILLLNSCGKSDAVDNSGTISGFVTDITNANAPIAGATVTLSAKGLSQTTGSDGRYQFSDVDPGSYTLQAIANHYQPTTKQVTVGVNQNVACDFQLSAGAVSVDISPVTLNFGNSAEQLSFTITNNSTGTLSYNISNIPNFVQVSPSTGSVAARGKQAVMVSVINRSSITAPRNGQMTVNIGSDSYTISVSVEPYQAEAVSVDISPASLTFDKDTEQMKFTMASNYSRDLDFTISSNLDILTVTPTSGTLTARGKAEVSVTVNDRKNVTTDRTGSLTISMGGNTYVVNVSVDKYEETTPSVNTEVRNGLFAYFPFENSIQSVMDTEFAGVGIGTSFVDSYDGSKALEIPATSSALLSIPNSLVDQWNMSVSFWVKDLYDGHIFHAVRSYDNKPAFILCMENGRLKFVVTRYHIGYSWSSQTSFTHSELSGWHMITLVSDLNTTSYSTITTKLYIDGILVDTVTEDDNVFTERQEGADKNYDACTKFIMGGELNESYVPKIAATRLVIDNLRFYRSRMLTAEEVKTIYNAEKK